MKKQTPSKAYQRISGHTWQHHIKATISSAITIITSHYLTHSTRQDNAISPKRRYCEKNE
jgi:nitrate reductase cytochrome c-type subunit